jgi:hypothetical protein
MELAAQLIALTFQDSELRSNVSAKRKRLSFPGEGEQSPISLGQCDINETGDIRILERDGRSNIHTKSIDQTASYSLFINIPKN